MKNLSHARTQRRKVIALLCCLFLASCGAAPAPEPQGKRYDFKGTVVSVDRTQQTATISHEEVKGFMDAMTMPFKIKDAWVFDVIKPGDEVQAALVVTDTSAWLEDVVLTQREPRAEAHTGASLPQPGDAVPDFRLVNQDGRPVSLKQYRGKALLLTFIYTRCPVPEYCSLMSSNFAALERELEKDAGLYARTHLLSVSFDPAHDTPKVLRSYGAATTGRYDKESFAHWEFVTGTADEVKKMAQFFGLTYGPEKDQIVHSLQTAIVAPDGRLLKLYPGNDWKPDDVLADLRALPRGDRQ